MREGSRLFVVLRFEVPPRAQGLRNSYAECADLSALRARNSAYLTGEMNALHI